MNDISVLAQYQKMLIESLIARSEGSEEKEDQISELLDVIWYELDETQKEHAKQFATAAADAYLDTDGNVVRKPTHETKILIPRYAANMIIGKSERIVTSLSSRTEFKKSSSNSTTQTFAECA